MSIVVNGKFFDWGDITISLLPLSSVLVTAKEIKWDEELEADPVYGQGRFPLGYAKGNWKASGSISLLKSEFEQLCIAAPNGVLNLDPRQTMINVLYNNTMDSEMPVMATTLSGIRFKKASESAAQGSKELLVNLDFLILDRILHNGKSIS